MKKSLKSRIEKEFEEGRLDQIADDLQEYRKECPYDRDLWFYECIEAMSIGDLELAQQIIEKCLRNFPTSYEAYYYQACIYQEKGEILDALKNYMITDFLCNYFKLEKTEIYSSLKQAHRTYLKMEIIRNRRGKCFLLLTVLHAILENM